MSIKKQINETNAVMQNLYNSLLKKRAIIRELKADNEALLWACNEHAKQNQKRRDDYKKYDSIWSS